MKNRNTCPEEKLKSIKQTTIADLAWTKIGWEQSEQECCPCYILCGKMHLPCKLQDFSFCSMFGKRKKILFFPVSRQQWGLMSIWITWRGDHVTTHILPGQSQTSTETLSRLQWKTTAAATVYPAHLTTTFWPPSPFLYTTFCSLISLCQHIPQTQPPSLPFEPPLNGKTEWREGKKWSAVVGICVSWTNRLHMLVVTVQDVACLIYSLFISCSFLYLLFLQ